MVRMAISRPGQHWWRIQIRILIPETARKVLPTRAVLISRQTMLSRCWRQPDSRAPKWKLALQLKPPGLVLENLEALQKNLEALAVGQSSNNLLLVGTLNSPGEASWNLPKNMYALMMTFKPHTDGNFYLFLILPVCPFNVISERLPPRWKRWWDCEDEPK